MLTSSLFRLLLVRCLFRDSFSPRQIGQIDGTFDRRTDRFRTRSISGKRNNSELVSFDVVLGRQGVHIVPIAL